MAWTVRAAADIANVSVRTLHHYDAIGLLSPSGRSEAGYRLYSPEDMLALEQILFFKEMGFSLGRIRELVSDPEFDRVSALELQRTFLHERIASLQDKVAAIELAIDRTEKGTIMDMDEKDIKEVFGDFDPREYEAEVEERWGSTDAYKESARRTKKYTKEDWKRIQAEGETNNARLAALFSEGAPADDPRVLECVHEHWRQINDNFYPCGMDIYEGLADMYIADPRFTATYEKIAPGFAQNLHDAMKAYVAQRRASDSK